jgi:hypothetical protein
MFLGALFRIFFSKFPERIFYLFLFFEFWRMGNMLTMVHWFTGSQALCEPWVLDEP